MSGIEYLYYSNEFTFFLRKETNEMEKELELYPCQSYEELIGKYLEVFKNLTNVIKIIS